MTVGVEEIRLSLPLSSRDQIGLLVMQPLVADKLIWDKGYRWKPEAKPTQIEHIGVLMDMALNAGAAGHNIQNHMVIIPEYAIPGADGIELIKQKLRDSSVQNQVVIGGIDGLDKIEFLSMLEASDLSEQGKSNITECVVLSDWINSAVIIEKSGNSIKTYYQPKMLPAPEEDQKAMCAGNTVLIFKTSPKVGNPICIMVPICFDWIGREGHTSKLDQVATYINSNINGINNAFWMLCAIQHNPKPDHINFLQGARERLTSEPWRSVFDTRACVIMANTATPIVGTKYGRSSFIFSTGRYYINGEAQPVVISKSRQILEGCCEEQRFRENGAAIHSCNFIPPTATSSNPADPRRPFRVAKVLCLESRLSSICLRRYPKEPTAVCPYVKVLGDYTDLIKNNVDLFYDTYPHVKKWIKQIVPVIIGNAQKWEKNEILRNIILLCQWKKFNINCDYWNFEAEGKALESLIIYQLLIYLAFGEISPNEVHGSFRLGQTHNALLVMDSNNEKSHPELRQYITDEIKNKRIRLGRCHRVLVIGNTRNEQGYRSTRGSLLEQAKPGSYIDTPIYYNPSRRLMDDLDNCKDIRDLNQRIIRRLEEI